MIRPKGMQHARRTRRCALAFAAICLSISSSRQAVAQEPVVGSVEGCALSARSAPRAVVRVIDGATLALDDGTQVRLIGALAPNSLDAAPAPRPRDAHDQRAKGAHDHSPARVSALASAMGSSASGDTRDAIADTWQPAMAARDAMERLVNGASVTLATSQHQRDRYGRVLAQVFVNGADGGTLWLQGALLAAGHARAYGLPDNFACMDALLAAEQPARRSGRGLWANPAYAIRSASHRQTLLRLRATYQIVAGTVRASQRTKSGWIYLNFGNDWRTDFSASLAPGVSRAHPAWAASLLDLKGQQVRVRGWIERRNGPSINIEHPSQIEVIGPSTAARLTAPSASGR